MSVCEVKYRGESGQLDLRFKFFWDDLEAVLEKRQGRPLDLTKPSGENDRILDEFVRANFNLKIDRTQVALRYRQAQVRDIVLLVEFDTSPVRAAASYEVDLTNKILLDAFSDQYNIVRFDFFGDGNLETLRFERAEDRVSKQVRKH